MSAREAILARIRSALADVPVGGAEVTVPRDYVRQRDIPDLLRLFVERVEDYKASVTLTGPGAVAPAVAAALGPARRVVTPAGLDQSWLPDGLDLVPDDPPLSAAELDQADAVVTTAAVGIAVTGTLVLDHGPGQGRRALSLVPDRHVCLIRADQVVDDVPAAVARLGEAVRAGRPLTWISGPSATSDIELDRVEGVHGPRTLQVVLVTDVEPGTHVGPATGPG